ncbi:MAG: hypothetical protein ACE5LG_07260 [Anaerolineae bacterium]
MSLGQWESSTSRVQSVLFLPQIQEKGEDATDDLLDEPYGAGGANSTRVVEGLGMGMAVGCAVGLGIGVSVARSIAISGDGF